MHHLKCFSKCFVKPKGLKVFAAGQVAKPPPAASNTHNHCCQSSVTRVSGHGPQAQAALVAYLIDEGYLEEAGEVARCCSKPLPGNPWVTVHQRQDGRRHAGGLSHCGRMVCPICAPYLMASRTEVLEQRVMVTPAPESSAIVENHSPPKTLPFGHIQADSTRFGHH